MGFIGFFVKLIFIVSENKRGGTGIWGGLCRGACLSRCVRRVRFGSGAAAAERGVCSKSREKKTTNPFPLFPLQNRQPINQIIVGGSVSKE